MIFINEKENSTLAYFSSMTELANVKVHPLNKETWDEEVREGRNNFKWFGVAGGRAAVREICELYGWKEGRELGFNSIKEIDVPRLPHYRRRRIRDDQGAALDIHSVYNGNLEKAWEGFEKSKHCFSYRGHVTIFINIGANQNVEAGSMFWRGAAAAVICKALIKSGRNVRIMACESTKDFALSTDEGIRGVERFSILTMLKDYSQPINFDNLFAATALAGFFRHYYFKVILSLPYLIKSSLGYVVSVQEQDFYDHMDHSPSIFIENIWSLSQAINRVENFKKNIERDMLENRNR